MDIWKNPEDENETAAIESPSWYEYNGTPICEESGEDMIYSHSVMFLLITSEEQKLYADKYDAQKALGSGDFIGRAIKILEIEVN